MAQNDDDMNEKVKVQVFQDTKEKELYGQIYPICVTQCTPADGNRNEKLVFTSEELKCAQNCLQKYKSSMWIAI